MPVIKAYIYNENILVLPLNAALKIITKIVKSNVEFQAVLTEKRAPSLSPSMGQCNRKVLCLLSVVT